MYAALDIEGLLEAAHQQRGRTPVQMGPGPGPGPVGGANRPPRAAAASGPLSEPCAHNKPIGQCSYRCVCTCACMYGSYSQDMYVHIHIRVHVHWIIRSRMRRMDHLKELEERMESLVEEMENAEDRDERTRLKTLRMELKVYFGIISTEREVVYVYSFM